MKLKTYPIGGSLPLLYLKIYNPPVS